MNKKITLSLIVPTYNEADNIADILKRAINALEVKAEYEILVVDDASVDNTAGIAQEALCGKGVVIRRQGTKSLSLSVLDGIKAAKGDIIVVMDADGSHPPELIPSFIETFLAGYDLIIGSRYVKGGGTEGFPLRRKVISRFACFLGGFVTRIKDNTSGFFCIRKSALDGILLTPSGFKIGLEVFVKSDFRSFKEIPFIFVNRKKGESKLKGLTVLQYLCQIINLAVYKMKLRNRK